MFLFLDLEYKEKYLLSMTSNISNIDNSKCLCRRNKLLHIHLQCNKVKTNGDYCGTHSKVKEKLLATEPLPKKYSKIITLSSYLKNGEKIFSKVSNLELLNTLRSYNLALPTKIDKTTKNNMINDIKNHFKVLSYYSSQDNIGKVKIIQNQVRNFLKNKEITLRGPGFLNRKLCNNQDDFLTFEPVEEIPGNYFFSFKDEDDFVYGFDIRSFNKLIESNMDNPYNRKKIPIQALKNLKILSKNPKFKFELAKPKISKEQKMNQRVLNVFQKIDQLDSYAGGTDINWFLNLSRVQLKSYYKVLEDIWNYRSELSHSRKNEIVPNYQMFSLGVPAFYRLNEKDKMRKILLNEMNMLVDSAAKREDKILGCYYVLIGLVEISAEVSNALPWLVQV